MAGQVRHELRAPSWPERWPINFIGRAVGGSVRTVPQQIPIRNRSFPPYPLPLACVAMKPKPEPEPAEAEAVAETEAEAFTASRLSVYSHCYKLTNSLSPVKEKRGRVERGVVNALRTRV